MRDVVLIEILKNRFQAAAEEMASVILRTGHTVFVKETGDFGAALISGSGEVFACPINTGVARMVGKPFKHVVRSISFDEGDVFIANDPVTTGGMATHLPDIHVWKPIFHDGEFVCFAWSFIHSSDVGGRVPGSIAPSNTDIFQEGLIIPPAKLYRRGELNEDLLNVILSNCRIREQNWGDIKALLAGLYTVEARMRRLIDSYGVATIRQGIEDVLDYAELQARDVIRAIPDGAYHFHDYMEGDVVPGGHPIRINLTLHVDGDDLLLDFSGTDPDVLAALNLPTHSTDGHWQVATAAISLIRTLRREIPFNDGITRPLHVRIPPRTILNPPRRAAVGVRAATSFRAFDCVMGALAQAIPNRVAAAGSSQGAMLLVAVPDPERIGEIKVSVVQPLGGGSGGRATRDGLDAVDTAMAFLRNIPTESIENEVPLVITRYALREDSGGAGRSRGGVGVELGLRLLQTQGTITARGMERYRFAPWGRDGGRPGTTGETILEPGTPRERSIGKIDVLTLDPGQELLIRTQGGGGFGDPLDRDPEDVLRDVRQELVSAESAAHDYGVVIAGDKIDVAATVHLRRSMRGSGEPPRYAFCPAREEYDRLWTEDLRRRVNALTDDLHGRLRYTARAALMTAIEARSAEHGTVSLDDVQALFDEIVGTVGSAASARQPAAVG